MTTHRQTRQIIAAALVLAGTFMARPAGAQEVPLLLLLDSNAVAAEQAPNLFTPDDLNAPIAGVGVREPLRLFAQNVDQTMVLPGGPAGHEGWFSMGSAPAVWATDTNTNDALQNLLLAGPGLGSPDEEGSRTSHLASVADVTPPDVAKLQFLAGRNACEIVFTNELPWSSSGTSLEGATCGVAAFSILSATTGSEGAIEVSIRILNVANTYGGALASMSF